MGRDRDKTCVQSGGGGCRVSCGGRKRVKVTKTGKCMERKRTKKNDKSGKKTKTKKVNFFVVVARENRPMTPTKKALRAFEAQVPPEKPYRTSQKDHELK